MVKKKSKYSLPFLSIKITISEIYVIEILYQPHWKIKNSSESCIYHYIYSLLLCNSLVMVILKLSSPTQVDIRAKLSVLELTNSGQKHSLNLRSSSSSPFLVIANSWQPQVPISSFPPTSQSVAAIVFGDSSESRLYPLTKRRSEGAIPIAANYRIIDAVVSNCINSNINKIYAITQFNSTSLNHHLSRAYTGVGLGKDGFVEVIAAYQSLEHQGWFQGTADAMRRCLCVLEEYPVSEFLILPGHHLYKMDYQKLIESHRSSQADITIASLNHTRNHDHDPGFGILKVNSQNEVAEFTVKSEKNAEIVTSVQSSKKSDDTVYTKVSSMGIYVVNREVMTKLLVEYFPKANNFATQVIPGAISTGMKVQAYLFNGYWEDLRGISAFYQANMECVKNSNIEYNFFDRDSPLYTMARYLPPTTIDCAVITDSVIGDGCILNRCKIKGTVVGMRTRIGDRAIVEDSVIMGSDRYQDDMSECRINGKSTNIPLGIGDDTEIRKAIIDKNARIGRNVKIINKDKVKEADREANGYIISDGIVVVLKSAVIADGIIL